MATIEKISQDECTAELLKELRWGRQVKETFQQVREVEAAAEAQALRGHKSIEGLGKCVAVIPQHEWFLMRAKYGQEAMHDKGFIRDFQKHEPSMAVNRI